MPVNLETSVVTTGLGKVSFHSNAKECSNYYTVALISHTSKVMLKILQARLQQCVNWELPNVQAGFRKDRGVHFSRSVVSDSLWPHGLQHTRLSCSSPTVGACIFKFHFMKFIKNSLISWLQYHLRWFWSPSLSLFSLFSHLFDLKWWDWMLWS